MSKEYIDMVGRQYGKLAVVEYEGTHNTHSNNGRRESKCR